MKTMKKLALVLCSVVALGMMAGCGFDASAYVKATLDNQFKNDPSGYVEQKVATEEEATALHDSIIDDEVNTYVSGLSVSDEVKENLRKTFENLYAAADYTVGEAKKEGNGYEVTVEYKKLNVFDAAITEYSAQVEALDTSSYDSTDAYYNDVLTILCDCINAELAKGNYGETESTTVSVVLEGKTYTVDQTSLQNLGTSFFDIPTAQ